MRFFSKKKRKKAPRNAVLNKPARRKKSARLPSEDTRRWMKFTRLGMTLMIMGGLLLVYIVSTLPSIGKLQEVKKPPAITVETADGRIVATYGDVYGTYVPYKKLPKHLIEAVIATEDRRFFVHHGVDLLGIARAMVMNLYHGRVVQGGSTVTQQLAKNLFLTPRRSIERKLQEVLIAFWLEGRYTKEEIMAIYLNRVYLGGGTFGVDAASRRYFNKPAAELNLLESAIIAGVLKAPARFAPTANVERAKDRATIVLNNMVDAGFIKPKEMQEALASFKKDELKTVEGNSARYFTDWVVDGLQQLIGNTEADLVVVTTLDPKLQEYARDAVENIVATEGPKKRVSQGALVAMTPDGAVKAMVGGTSYATSQYNRAAQAKRQPGSVFKLFVYLAALEAGYTPLSTVVDAPIEIQVGTKIWSPDNFSSGEYQGEMAMVDALRQSLNTVSVRLSQYAGLENVANMAMRLGIPDVPAYSSIALGAVEATLVELTGAYAHLANDGNKVVPYGVLSVRTTKGEEIYKRETPSPEPLLAKSTVEMMNYMLLRVVQAGTGTRAAIGRPAAGKTGTSSDYKDAWFIGFTPQLVVGTWVGNDDNKKMLRVTGGSLPAGIWHDFMLKAMQGQKPLAIPNSQGSNEGTLPWLFGASNHETPEESDANAEGGTTPPEERPVERIVEQVRPNPPVEVPATNVGTLPWQAAEPVSAENAPQPAAQESGDVLTPAFWNKLMSDAPKVKVEHVYPDSGAR